MLCNYKLYLLRFLRFFFMFLWNKKKIKTLCIHGSPSGQILCHIGPNFRFGPTASLKTFCRGKGPNRPVAQFFDRMPWYLSVGFRWSVGQMSVALLPCLSSIKNLTQDLDVVIFIQGVQIKT